MCNELEIECFFLKSNIGLKHDFYFEKVLNQRLKKQKILLWYFANPHQPQPQNHNEACYLNGPLLNTNWKKH